LRYLDTWLDLFLISEPRAARTFVLVFSRNNRDKNSINVSFRIGFQWEAYS
jgi:hypothetical protein